MEWGFNVTNGPCSDSGSEGTVSRTFRLLLLAYLVLFAANAVLGWMRPPFPGVGAKAPEFVSVAGVATAILQQNLEALAVLVFGNVVSIGIFGIVMFTVNGYLAGGLMQAAAPHAPAWLWSFVLPEMLAFATAGAAATATATGKVRVVFAVRAVAMSAAVLCAAAVLEAVLIRWAWGL